MDQKKNNNKKSSNTLKSIAIFTGIAAQMGITIYLGAYFGKSLDLKYPAEKKWFTIIFTLLGVGIALYIVIKQLNKFNSEEKK